MQLLTPAPFSGAAFEPGDPGIAAAGSIAAKYQKNNEVMDLVSRMEKGIATQDECARFADVLRAVSSSQTAFPVRENLDAEVHVLTPVTTPLRNMLPRVPGSGTAAQQRVQSAFGAGLATQTTTSGTTNAVNTIVVANSQGFFVGETVLVNGATSYGPITAVNNSTNVISFASGPSLNSQTNGQTVLKTSLFFPETNTAARIFYGEAGAPVENTTSYVNTSFTYRLLGDMGGVSMFAVASGDSFMNQYETEKRNTLIRALLKEEYSLLHAQSGVTQVPWGDGTTAFAYQGMLAYINANAPAAQLQTSVGALTVNHIQTQLNRIWYQGARRMVILCAGQEANSLTNIMTAAGNYRIIVDTPSSATASARIAKIIHTVSGEEVEIMVHPFLAPGTMVFFGRENGIGQPTVKVSVLPQVRLPDSAFAQDAGAFQGYYAQEIAPSSTDPETLRFKVSTYSVPMFLNSRVFALSTGITASGTVI